MKQGQYDIAISNYMALPGLMPGVLFFGSKSPDSIIDAVVIALGVERSLLRSRTRIRHIVEARQIAIYLIKKNTTMSLAQIGKMFGGRDHTTAIHSINTVKNLCLDETYKQRLLKIENLL